MSFDFDMSQLLRAMLLGGILLGSVVVGIVAWLARREHKEMHDEPV